ncbi:nitrile hydratase subunit alpha [Marinivivus vitaminiproducens]|uniref:nitrile hydratase subunit alpha n=1 Tax=Marinivivus vitaminiproducens TaxID=3035935 RepID=UPI0027A55E6F|nr:nitrile hydratase subunit alpha [Geminicoccaceae bacterium SCSIO 64248]
MSHAHDHPHDDGHRHPFQPDLEDAPFAYHQVLAQAVGDVLVAKGVFTAEDLRRQIEAIDAAEPARGARLVARAWIDGGFRERLLRDVNAAAAELGVDAGGIPIRAVANEPGVHNLIVCTLCSCYPRLLIGLPPDWYKSRAYRSRAIREPRAVLAEFGTAIPDDIEVRVHDSTADLRYMVLPLRPEGTEGWDETRLAGLVTRDSMIGVALPRVPAAA